MGQRPSLFKCPNYQDCLTGYRGEDIEIHTGIAEICPECGAALIVPKRQSPKWLADVINGAIVAAIATLVWLAWPSLKKLWSGTAPEAPAAVK